MSFEDRLAAAFDHYADRAPLEVDVRDLIGVVAVAGRGRRVVSAPARWPRWTGLRLAVVIGLATILATAAVLAVGSLSTKREPSLVLAPSPSSSTSTVTSVGDGRLLVFAPGSGELEVLLPDGRRLLSDADVTSGCPHLVGGMAAVVLDHPRHDYRYRVVPFDGEPWDVFTASITQHETPADTVFSERWSPDHRRILQVAYGTGIDVVSIGDSHEATEAWYPVPGVVGVAWAVDGRRLAVVVDVGTDREVRILDAADGRWRTVSRIPNAAGGLLADPAWGAGDATIATPVSDAVVKDVDVATGAVAQDHLPRVPLDTSRDGSRTVVWDPVRGLVLEAADGSILVVLGTDLLGRPSFAPDGRYLAYMAADGLVNVRTDGRERQTLPLRDGAFAWSPDGTMLAVAERTGAGGVTVDLVPPSDLTSAVPLTVLAGPDQATYGGTWPPPGPCLEWEAPATP